MSSQYETVLNEALKLSAEDRQMLAKKLELSILGLSEEELVNAWAKLADKRFQEYKKGNAIVYEVKDVIEEARKRSNR